MSFERPQAEETPEPIMASQESDPELEWFKTQALAGVETPLYPGVMNRMKGIWDSSQGDKAQVVEAVNEYIKEEGLAIPDMKEADVELALKKYYGIETAPVENQ